MAIYPSGPSVYPWSLVFPGAVLSLSQTTAIPEFQVHIGWESTASGAFILDASTLNSPDLLDGFGVDAFSGTYDNVSADVASPIRIRRGRNDFLSAMQAGEVEFELFRPSNVDFYNPNASATAAPIRGKTPGFAPMRPVRIQAVYGGVTFPVFVGYIRRMEWDSDTKRAKVNVVDLFLWLSRARPTFSNAEASAAGVTNTSSAINFLLAKSNWTRSSLIDMDSRGGDTVSSFSSAATSNKTALSIIEDLLVAERGYFVISPEGEAKYRSRVDRAAKTSSATFESEQTDYGSALDLDRITNKITVTASGSSFPQTISDASSIATYGLSEGSGISSTYITSDATALALANYLVGLYSTPRPPVSITLANDSPLTLIRQLTLDIGDRVTIPSNSTSFTFGASTFGGTAGFGGATDDYHIEQIEHRISDGGNYIETSYILSQRGAESFVFGRSKFDSQYELFTF